MNKIRKCLLLILLSYAIPGFGQVTFFDFQVFTPLPTIEMGSFMSANGLRNTQRLFLVTIVPEGQPVSLEGIIRWRDINSSSYKLLYRFVTRPFNSRNFDNTDIGVSDVKLAINNFDSQMGEEIVKRGKPVGDFEFTCKLLTANGADYPGFNEIKRYLSFPNPAQTISIISPSANSNQDLTNVLAQWTQAVGASEYLVKIGVRSNPSQSLEEALNSGVPLANNKSVGTSTSVNLFTLLDRQWQQNQEIVFQVTAVLPGPGGGEKLYSEIVNFKFLAQEQTSDTGRGSTKGGKKNQSSYTVEELKRIFSGISNSDLQNFLNNCGEILEIVDQNGNVISRIELQRILDYLKQHPDAIINIVPELKSSNPNKSEETK